LERSMDRGGMPHPTTGNKSSAKIVVRMGYCLTMVALTVAEHLDPSLAQNPL
jgi:hypothetical protein